MTKDLVQHLYGFSNGVYFAVIVMLVLFGLSYLQMHRRQVSIAFVLVALAFACFALLNIFFQLFVSDVTDAFYPPWFFKFAAMVTPVSVIILTYIYVTGFSMRSVVASQIVKREKWIVYVIYALMFAIIVGLSFVDDPVLMLKVILLGFLPPCIGAAGLAIRSYEHNMANLGFGVLFVALVIVNVTLGWYFVENHHVFSEGLQVALNLVFALVVVFACFITIRFGYTEVRSFFKMRALDELDVLSEISSGISQNQFRLDYQPQLNLQTSRVTGVEALLRWQHPSKGNIPPLAYISLAEESNLINGVTMWVVSRAIKQAKRLYDMGYPLKTSVNFSTKNFNPMVVNHVAKELKRHKLPSELLVVEITESIMIKMEDNAFVDAMAQLRSLGVRVSIDDYGTGFSSLSYMQRFHVHELKIDKSFIDNLDYDSNDYAIVFSTIQMARNLGMETVAEGVEDGKAIDILTELRCNAVQGYGIAKPMPFDDLVRWLSKQNQDPSYYELRAVDV